MLGYEMLEANRSNMPQQGLALKEPLHAVFQRPDRLSDVNVRTVSHNILHHQKPNA